MSVTLVSAVQAELGDLPGHAVGIGPLRSALGAWSVLAGGTGPVILLGSAGVYPGCALPIGQAVVSSSLGLSGGIAELGLGYQPVPDPVLEGAVGWFPALPACTVLTVPAITSDPDLARQRGQAWQIEHMESYGVAAACARLGRPFVAVLGISNEVGPLAHEQWKAHRHQAEAAAQAAVRSFLQARTGGRTDSGPQDG